jgi:hypothetical protein
MYAGGQAEATCCGFLWVPRHNRSLPMAGSIG